MSAVPSLWGLDPTFFIVFPKLVLCELSLSPPAVSSKQLGSELSFWSHLHTANNIDLVKADSDKCLELIVSRMLLCRFQQSVLLSSRLNAHVSPRLSARLPWLGPSFTAHLELNQEKKLTWQYFPEVANAESDNEGDDKEIATAIQNAMQNEAFSKPLPSVAQNNGGDLVNPAALTLRRSRLALFPFQSGVLYIPRAKSSFSDFAYCGIRPAIKFQPFSFQSQSVGLLQIQCKDIADPMGVEDLSRELWKCYTPQVYSTVMLVKVNCSFASDVLKLSRQWILGNGQMHSIDSEARQDEPSAFVPEDAYALYLPPGTRVGSYEIPLNQDCLICLPPAIKFLLSEQNYELLVKRRAFPTPSLPFDQHPFLSHF